MATIRPNELAQYLKKRVNDSQKKTFAKWQEQASKIIKEEVESYLDEGKSPVEGQGKYEPYSPAYAKKKGKPRNPVNLKDTGKMRASAKVRKVEDGISFWLSSKIAKYHNGQGRVNRLIYPTKQGQKFARPIRQRLAKLYVRLFKIT